MNEEPTALEIGLLIVLIVISLLIANLIFRFV